MNRRFISLMAASILAASAMAQGTAPMCGKQCDRPMGGQCPKVAVVPELRAQQQTERMAKELNLTAEQQKKVERINLSLCKTQDRQCAKTQKAKDKAKKVKGEARKKTERAMAKSETRLKDVLTAEQYIQLQENRDRAVRMHGHCGMKSDGKCDKERKCDNEKGKD